MSSYEFYALATASALTFFAWRFFRSKLPHIPGPPSDSWLKGQFNQPSSSQWLSRYAQQGISPSYITQMLGAITSISTKRLVQLRDAVRSSASVTQCLPLSVFVSLIYSFSAR